MFCTFSITDFSRNVDLKISVGFSWCGFLYSKHYAVTTEMLSIMKPVAPSAEMYGKSISTMLNGCPFELKVNVPSG